MLDLAQFVLDITGSSSGVTHKPLPTDDPTRRCPDITLARTALGWEPTTGLRDGIARTIAYFEQRVGREAP
jgi:UDP-glucuronate decarboxylase